MALALTLIGTATWQARDVAPLTRPSAHISDHSFPHPRVVFLPQAGPTGGGGGGNRQRRPPMRAQALGPDQATVPITKPVRPSLSPAIESAPPPPPLLLDAKPLAFGTTFLPGLGVAVPEVGESLGPGVGGGVGDGRGAGVGSGRGPGLGRVAGGGFGGGAYRVGNGVVAPIVLKEVKPQYTSEALRRRIQGIVTLEVVVGRDGVPYTVRVMRSLDPGGLDETAVAAAREWRFAPGRSGDTPVDVLVTILLEFMIR